MPPITFNQVNSLPDLLDAGRHQLIFPTIHGIDGTNLTLHHAEIQLPKRGVAQVSVKFLGHTANFRGSSESDNTITVSFYEDSKGNVLKGLFGWLKLVRNGNDGTSKLKADYAQPAVLHLYDTMGNPALTFKIVNMFPITVDLPQLSEQSGPVKISATFSIDYIALDGDEATSPGTQASTVSGFNYSRPGNDTNLGGILNGGGLNLSAGANIGPFSLRGSVNVPMPVNALTMVQFASQFSSFL